MLNVVLRAFRQLFPEGNPWQFFEDFGHIKTAIGMSLRRAKDYVGQAVLESNPSTANDTLPNWFRSFNISYDPNLSLGARQGRASQIYTAIGGQWKSYIESIIQKAFPDIFIEETFIPYSSMAGLGMAGDMQATNYQSWIPLEFQDGTFPIYLFRVIGTVDSPNDFLRLQDIIAKVAPVRLEPIYVDIEFFVESMMAGIGGAGRGQAGR